MNIIDVFLALTTNKITDGYGSNYKFKSLIIFRFFCMIWVDFFTEREKYFKILID